MDTSAVVNALNANGLSAYTSLVNRLALPALRLEAWPTPDESIHLGVSRLGGLPDLPPGQGWPEMNGAPMSFVGQIRLQETHAIPGGEALPATGLLSFFYDASQQTYGSDPKDRAGFSVLYFPEAAQASVVHQTAYPAALPEAARFQSAADAFHPIATYVQDLQAEFPDRQISPQDQQHFESALNSLPPPPPHISHHQVLGHPDTIQDDMRQQCQFATNGLADPSSDPVKARTLAASANDWRLLLQVDSDQRFGINWGSAGMLYFWIRQQDLAGGNFNNCWVVLQSE
jgi:uncharacterized protein YwqG